MAVIMLAQGWTQIGEAGDGLILRHALDTEPVDLTFAEDEPPLDASGLDIWTVAPGDGVVIYPHRTGLTLWAATAAAELSVELLTTITAPPGHRLNLIAPRHRGATEPAAPHAVGTIPDQLDFVVTA